VRTFRLSAQATDDLLGIASYTWSTWGEAQMTKYVDGMEQCAQLLAKNPGLGRLCEWITPGLHRFEKAEHVIYYRQKEYGIRVLRILHRSVNPNLHEFEDEDEAPDSPNLD
jgi:toxin ParE1/3/4